MSVKPGLVQRVVTKEYREDGTVGRRTVQEIRKDSTDVPAPQPTPAAPATEVVEDKAKTPKVDAPPAPPPPTPAAPPPAADDPRFSNTSLVVLQVPRGDEGALVFFRARPVSERTDEALPRPAPQPTPAPAAKVEPAPTPPPAPAPVVTPAPAVVTPPPAAHATSWSSEDDERTKRIREERAAADEAARRARLAAEAEEEYRVRNTTRIPRWVKRLLIVLLVLLTILLLGWLLSRVVIGFFFESDKPQVSAGTQVSVFTRDVSNDGTSGSDEIADLRDQVDEHGRRLSDHELQLQHLNTSVKGGATQQMVVQPPVVGHRGAKQRKACGDFDNYEACVDYMLPRAGNNITGLPTAETREAAQASVQGYCRVQCRIWNTSAVSPAAPPSSPGPDIKAPPPPPPPL